MNSKNGDTFRCSSSPYSAVNALKHTAFRKVEGGSASTLQNGSGDPELPSAGPLVPPSAVGRHYTLANQCGPLTLRAC